jgi:hypothetical protein
MLKKNGGHFVAKAFLGKSAAQQPHSIALSVSNVCNVYTELGSQHLP